jgi:hypothetical protein
MPLTSKGEEIKGAMEKEYGKEKGESVFYASANKGTIKGVHDAVAVLADAVAGLGARFDAYDDRRRADAKRDFPSYTLAQLEKWIAEGTVNNNATMLARVKKEIEARKSGASQAFVTPQIEGGKPTPKVGRL